MPLVYLYIDDEKEPLRFYQQAVKKFFCKAVSAGPETLDRMRTDGSPIVDYLPSERASLTHLVDESGTIDPRLYWSARGMVNGKQAEFISVNSATLGLQLMRDRLNVSGHSVDFLFMDRNGYDIEGDSTIKKVREMTAGKKHIHIHYCTTDGPEVISPDIMKLIDDGPEKLDVRGFKEKIRGFASTSPSLRRERGSSFSGHERGSPGMTFQDLAVAAPAPAGPPTVAGTPAAATATVYNTHQLPAVPPPLVRVRREDRDRSESGDSSGSTKPLLEIDPDADIYKPEANRASLSSAASTHMAFPSPEFKARSLSHGSPTLSSTAGRRRSRVSTIDLNDVQPRTTEQTPTKTKCKCSCFSFFKRRKPIKPAEQAATNDA